MKTIQLIIVFCFGILFLGQSNEPPKLKRANKLYQDFAYAEAIQLYEELASQGIEIEFISEKLANAYRFINDSKNSEKWYKTFIDLGKYSANDAYYYSMALRSNGNIQLADNWMLKFKEMNANDSRAKEFVSKDKKLAEIKKKRKNYTITNLNFNTNGIEFSPFNMDDKTLGIVAANSKKEIIKREFAWNKTPFLDFYTLKKINDTTFSTPEKLKGKINSKYHEGPGQFVSKDSTIYFTRNNYIKQKKLSEEGILKLKIFKSQKNKKGKWNNIEEINLGNSNYSYGHPTISLDGNKLFFTSDMPGSIGGTDIWMIEKKSNRWSTPVNLGPDINTEGNEMFPFITTNGDLFFASNGHFGLGGLDVFYAPFKNNEYKHVFNVGEGINSIKDDFGLIANDNMTKVYFSSNREGGKGDDDIYFANILEPIQVKLLSIKVKDIETGSLLVNTNVTIKQNEKTFQYKTNSNGEIELIIDPYNPIEITTSLINYKSQTTLIIPDETNNHLNETIYLAQGNHFYLNAIVKDFKTKKTIENATIILRSNKKKLTFTTDVNGEIYIELPNAKIGDSLSYSVAVIKAGYFGKEFSYKQRIDTSKNVYTLNTELDLSLHKIEKGTEIGKAINILPIYFDLDKDEIRKDAALELDKVITILKKYPNINIELGSHTDCRGSLEYNDDLSERRAESSKNYIISRGIDANRLYWRGYGETKLVNKCECDLIDTKHYPEKLHQQNRRTEFVIVEIEQ